MSVPVGRRKPSTMCFKNTALKIHKLVMRAGEEKFMLKPEEYEAHKWSVDITRNEMARLAKNLIFKIEEADSIHVTNEKELTARVLAIEYAMALCNSIAKNMQLALLSFDVNENRYFHLITLCDKEIVLLKGLRRSDRNRFKKQVSSSAKAMEGANDTTK